MRNIQYTIYNERHLVEQRTRVLRRWMVGPVAVLMMLMVGCGQKVAPLRERLGMLADPRLDAPIRKSLVATGGVDAWAQAQSIEGGALITLFDADGGQSLVEQHHQIVSEGTVAVRVATVEPEGMLYEDLDSDGRVEVVLRTSEKDVRQTDPVELREAVVRLRLIGQAITGAAGLCQPGFTLRHAGTESKGGRLMHKIEVTGGLLGEPESFPGEVSDLMTAWIDAGNHRLVRLWMRYRSAEAPGQWEYLAANLSDARELAGGLIVPGRIELVGSDQYQQFSKRGVLTVEYLELTAKEQGKKGKGGLLAGFF